MPSQAIQISLPKELLRAIDARPEVKKLGRSAVVQRALRLYLEEARRREIDAEYDRAYGGKADELLREFGPLMARQAWPEE